MSLLEFRQVSRSFPDAAQPGAGRAVLREVSFRLAPGEVAALVGRSGAGKTTLLHLAAGLCRPSAGQIFFEGRDLASFGPGPLSALRRHQIGLVFQNNLSLAALPVWENAAFPLLLGGVSAAAARRQTEPALERLGLAGLAQAPTATLSGGQRRRLGLARAMLGQPRLLLADEPTADLDEETAAELEKILFTWLAEERRAALIVTHAPTIEQAAARRFVLSEGRLSA